MPDEPRFPATRDVRVQLVDALKRVMLQVVGLERDRARKDVREIRGDRGDPVPGRATEHEVVRALVDEHPEGVIQEGADEERGEERGPDRNMGHERGERGLQHDENGHEKGAPGVSSGVGTNLRMAAENLARPESVRLTLGGEEKVLSRRRLGRRDGRRLRSRCHESPTSIADCLLRIETFPISARHEARSAMSMPVRTWRGACDGSGG